MVLLRLDEEGSLGFDEHRQAGDSDGRLAGACRKQ